MQAAFPLQAALALPDETLSEMTGELEAILIKYGLLDPSDVTDDDDE